MYILMFLLVNYLYLLQIIILNYFSTLYISAYGNYIFIFLFFKSKIKKYILLNELKVLHSINNKKLRRIKIINKLKMI